jgi:hypothetical protein
MLESPAEYKEESNYIEIAQLVHFLEQVDNSEQSAYISGVPELSE